MSVLDFLDSIQVYACDCLDVYIKGFSGKFMVWIDLDALILSRTESSIIDLYKDYRGRNHPKSLVVITADCFCRSCDVHATE